MRPYLLFPGLFVLTAFLSMPAFADDENDARQVGERPGYIVCLRETGGITVKILSCNGQEQSYQDRCINTAYRTLMASVPAAERQDLGQKERTWIKDRDNKCTEPKDSGTAGDIDCSSCLLQETAKQATKLESMLRNKVPS